MTKPTEQLIDEILTDIEYALDPAVDEIVLKNAREKIEKIVAEAIERTQKEDLAVIDGVISAYPPEVFIEPSDEWLEEVHAFCVSKGHTLDAISAHMARRAGKIIKKEFLSLRDNPIKEK